MPHRTELPPHFFFSIKNLFHHVYISTKEVACQRREKRNNTTYLNRNWQKKKCYHRCQTMTKIESWAIIEATMAKLERRIYFDERKILSHRRYTSISFFFCPFWVIDKGQKKKTKKVCLRYIQVHLSSFKVESILFKTDQKEIISSRRIKLWNLYSYFKSWIQIYRWNPNTFE